ncbi:MAG: SLBB domain-containing protein [Anaerolineae bacterium]|nr:SLBB domain-containing protein [Anaerolineae bacterium]
MDETPLSQPVLERFKYPVFLLVAGIALAGIVVLLWRRPEPTTITVLPPEPTPIPTVTPTPGPYMVYVTGAVASPEAVITLPFGSRVLHAVDAAGGPDANADLSRVNLAQRLEDGDQVHVPTREGAVESGPGPTHAAQVVTVTPGTVTVYVVGEVAQPEALVSLPIGSRVEDAITAAGGTTTNADRSRVNLSQILDDGDLVYVPPLDGPDMITPTPNHPALVHVNQATQAELESLPGIGPSLAQTIIDYRTENGPFNSLEDMDRVPGIGPSKLEALRDFVVFD